MFTICACGYIPCCALEDLSSGDRLKKIIDLIDSCTFSIHDISLTELDHDNMPRFNMPFELGLAYARKYQKKPSMLVMDRELHRFKSFLSDLKGCDAAAHAGDPLEVITQVRHWLSSNERLPLNGPIHMRNWYAGFQSDLPGLCAKAGFHRNALTSPDFVFCSLYWLDNYVPLRGLTF